MNPRSVHELVAFCQAIFDDLDFTHAREWKAAQPGRGTNAMAPLAISTGATTGLREDGTRP